jgi:class 3 adenylate cyclase
MGRGSPSRPAKSSDKPGGSRLETAHILFLDVVGYSTFPLDQQIAVFRGLQDIVNKNATVTETAAEGEVIRTPTGDGMALVFFARCPVAIHCAIELSEQIETEGGFAVRMGIHSGEVARQVDVNGVMNVSGDGINIAQRVMDFGDGGHILLSLAYAKKLQESGDSTAADCHDIGVASAKHGKQIHLFNYHRPAIGTPDVPARVRMDDEWIRPKDLRLGTAGRGLVIATLQILGWLLTRPMQWRTHVTQIDPRLSPNFTVIDLSGPQIRRNRDLRVLLLQVYVVCPALLGLLVLAALLPMKSGEGVSAVASVFTLIGMGYLVSVLLGIGAAFVGFVILAFQAIVEGAAMRLFGIVSFGHALALSAVCAWAFVSLCAVFPRRRSLPVWREVIAALLCGFATILTYTSILLISTRHGLLYKALTLAILSFVFVALTIGVRWRRWARGFVFGQAIGLLIGGAYYFAADQRSAMPVVLHDIITGFTSGLFSAVLWAMAFAVAEKFGDSRAAIASGLLVTIALNDPGKAWVIPFVVLWVTYAWMRWRSVKREQSSSI